MGGSGIRYTCRIGRNQTYLFLDDNRWFVEKKVQRRDPSAYAGGHFYFHDFCRTEVKKYMTYLKIGETLYPAKIHDRIRDRSWGLRESKHVTLESTYEETSALFKNDMKWSIV